MTIADRIETCRGILNARLVIAQRQVRVLGLAGGRPAELQCLLDMLADVERALDPTLARQLGWAMRQLAHIEKCLEVQQ